MIFIQVASYRDVELEWTIRDCRAKARHPDSLRFAVVAQTIAGEAPPDLKHIPGVNMIHIVPQVGQGVGYVRALANSMYNGEDYYLQIDSHTRFDGDWDLILINQIEASQATRPVVSTYPPMFWYPNQIMREDNIDFGTNNSTVVLTATGWHNSRTLILEPHVLPNRCQTPGFALAGGFIFTTGDFARIVPYEPRIMFIGEEIVLSIQAYTRGYDILSPSASPLYHHYTREHCVKPWTDSSERAKAGAVSEAWVSRLLESGGPPGYFGASRTLRQFQEYCGINFRDFTIAPNWVNKAQVQRPKPF